ncbi:unnamed protein product, partial [Effrenium voratum]
VAGPAKAKASPKGGLLVTELRKRLKALGLPINGSKAVLEARYEAAVSNQDSEPPAENSTIDRQEVKRSPSPSRSPLAKRPKVEPQVREEEEPEMEEVEMEELDSPRSSLDFAADLEAQLDHLEAEAAQPMPDSAPLAALVPSEVQSAAQGPTKGQAQSISPAQKEAEKEEAEFAKDAKAEGLEPLATGEDMLPDRYRRSLGSPHQDLIEAVVSSQAWRRPGLRNLVRSLHDLDQVERGEVPKRIHELGDEKLAELLLRYQEAVERPLQAFSQHLKPALARRIHVGTMDYMGGSHESYRRTFEFIEMTNTWFDLDSPTREISSLYRDKLSCSYKPPAVYQALAERAVDKRDSFRMVVKVSCVATHILKLQNVTDWWPKLWQEKYCHLSAATVAFLWQFPPSFVYSDELVRRFERLIEYLNSPASGVQEARHIVDFRDGSWYREDVYDFLRKHRWCLAWLHLNNTSGWASNLPSGWTDRVQTTNFCFCRLFGPDGQSHGTYDNEFLHELFDSCPMGTTSYVLFGNKETLEDSNPDPVPATLNAVSFRTIFTKMDFVERIRDVRYKGKCPRILTPEETLLINSFYLRFSQKARAHGIQVTSPVCSQWTRKYKPEAPKEKRSYEWYFPDTGDRLHLGLHDAKEEEDLWVFLRQLTGMEDLQAAKDYAWNNAGQYGLEAFRREDVSLLVGSMVRWSEKARMRGLLSSTKLNFIHKDGKSMEFLLSNGEKLWLSTEDLKEEEDLWKWILDLSRVPVQKLVPAEPAKENDPWKDGSWKRNAQEMWDRKRKEGEKGDWWEDKTFKGADQASASTQVCWNFQQGTCLHGSKCRYSHGDAPAGSVQGQVCFAFQRQGFCKWGDRCHRRHEEAPKRNTDRGSFWRD